MKGTARFMTRRPLALGALCLVIGSAAGCAAATPGAIWGAAMALCGLIFLINKRLVWIFCALMFLGAWSCAALGSIWAEAPERALITGRIFQVEEQTEERCVLTLDQVKFDEKDAGTKVRLYLYDQYSFLPGQHISCQARIWRPSGQTNPGGFDFSAWLRRDGVLLCATGTEATIGKGRPGLWAQMQLWRDSLGERLEQLLGEHGSLARGLLLGDKSALPDETYARFRNAGIAHLLAVSGLHITCLAGAVSFFLSLAGISRLRASLAALALALGYALLVGASPSSVRAVCMFGVISAARWQRYPYDPLTALGASALVLLAFNPLHVADSGFILSFSAVLGILLLYRPLVRLGRIDRWPRPVRWLGKSLALSASAQLGIMPALCCLFGQVTPYGPLVNLAAIPLSTALLPVLALTLALDALWPLAGQGAAWIAGILMDLLEKVTDLGAALPGAVLHVGTWPWLIILLYALCCFMASDYVAFPSRMRLAFLPCLPLCLALVLGCHALAVPRGLHCLFLDAGQADAAVVTAQRRTYLVDVGDAGGPMLQYLRTSGRKVDGVFLSHGDVDHAGSLGELLEENLVPVIYIPDGFEQSGPEEEVLGALEQARSQGISVISLARGDELQLSPLIRAAVLAPEKDSGGVGNQISMVLRIAYDQGSVLFTGDLPITGENQYLIPSTLLKVPHHGSKDSASTFLLQAVSPTACVISVGRNSYGHPSQQLLDRLAALDIPALRTDQSGAIQVDILPDGGLEVQTYL